MTPTRADGLVHRWIHRVKGPPPTLRGIFSLEVQPVYPGLVGGQSAAWLLAQPVLRQERF